MNTQETKYFLDIEIYFNRPNLYEEANKVRKTLEITEGEYKSLEQDLLESKERFKRIYIPHQEMDLRVN